MVELDLLRTGMLLGFILIFAGIAVIFFSVLSSALKQEGARGEYGGAVVIGPIPIVFGSSERAVKIAVLGALVLMAFAVALILIMSRGATFRSPF